MGFCNLLLVSELHGVQLGRMSILSLEQNSTFPTTPCPNWGTLLSSRATIKLDLDTCLRRSEDILPLDHSQVATKLNPRAFARLVCVPHDHRVVA